MKSRALVAIYLAAAAIGLGLATSAFSQPYPNRPITFIYPYAAGSLSDTAWRMVVSETSKRLGQTIVFDNRPGAGGRIGFDAVMRARPDGYTIGGAPNAISVVQPLVDPRLYVEPDKHYVPVITTFETYLLLVARANAPFRDLRGLIAYAKANPGKLNAGTPGVGTGSHLALAMLGTQMGIDYAMVHYKGSAPALTAMLSGEIDIMVSDPAVKSYVDAGRMMGLGTTGPQRWGVFPSLPTMQEAGAPGFNFSSWHGVIAPPGLAQDITVTLNQAFNEALKSPDVRSRLESAGWVVKGGSATEAGALIRGDLDTFRPIVRAAGIKLD